jgi:hypothetical protein
VTQTRSLGFIPGSAGRGGSALRERAAEPTGERHRTGSGRVGTTR